MSSFCPRVVFLIDTNRLRADRDVLLVQIHLTTLRILSFYAHNSIIQDTRNGVLWGYKFFNSLREETKYDCKRYPFLDFTTKHYDAFEKELYNLFQDNLTHETSEHTKVVENLKVTITNLLADFHWERPELFSPNKRQTRPELDDGVNNFVFMFSSAPLSNKQLQKYFELSETFSESDLIKKLLPKSLYSKFVKQLKIRLLWIDVNNVAEQLTDFSQSLLQKALQSINGGIIPIQSFTFWWLQQKHSSSKKKFIDVLNNTSVMKGLTTSKKKKQLNVSCRHRFKIDSEMSASSSIFLCPIQQSKMLRECIESEDRSIEYCEMMSKEDLDPSQLDISSSYFYTLSFTDEDEKLMFLIKNAVQYSQILKIKWKPCEHSQDTRNSVMIPSTPKFGTIILLNEKVGNEVSSASNATNEELEEDPLALVLKTKLTNWDFGTALVNCADSWFLYNPNLGFKTAARNLLRKLYKEQLVRTQNYEEKSKELLLSLKKSIEAKEDAKRKKEEKETGTTSEQQGLKIRKPKQKRLKGLTWARWRLQEYQRKQSEKLSATGSAEVNLNEGKEIVDDTETIVLPKQLEVEEFISQIEMSSYLKNEWEILQQKECFNHRMIERFVMTPIQHFSSIDEGRCQELAINLLRCNYLKPLNEVRATCSTYLKQDLMRQYLLQVHLLMECATALQGNFIENMEPYTNQVVSFLRSLIFEESIFYVRNYMKNHVLPYFLDRNNALLLDIYEDLMFDLPKRLEDYQEEQEKKKKEEDGEQYDDFSSSPLKSLLLPSSVGTSEPSSISSQQSEKRTLRRIPSAISENSHHKMISVVPTKKNATSKKNSRKSSSGTMRSDVQTVPPKTPTLKRRHSEIIPRNSIPETPEGKQRNDLIWKKQELNRRVSKVDKRMKPIEESPLKHLTSPVKMPISLYRSNSFSVRSSPRRFYAVRRMPYEDTEEENKPEEEILPALRPRPLSRNSSVKDILFSNFSSPPSKQISKQDSGVEEREPVFSGDLEFEQRPRPMKTRRNIFDIRDYSETSGTDTLSIESADNISLQRIECNSLSPTKEKACKRLRLSVSDDMGIHRHQPKLLSENTLDWLSEIDQNVKSDKTEAETHTPALNLSFREAFENFGESPASAEISPKLLKKPFEIGSNQGVKQSPTIIKAGRESITVSPLLSASSIEMLENAPILSPISNKRSKKRRALNDEYTVTH